MDLAFRFALSAIVVGTATVPAQEIDITNRSVTDPLLKVITSMHFLSDRDDEAIEAERAENSVPPKYSRCLGKRDVLLLGPLAEDRPGEIDFSAITSASKGKIRLSVRNHPAGDFVLQIVVDGKTVEKKPISENDWERFTIHFDHEPVVIRDVASGWYYEFAFIEYSIATQ